MTVATASPQRPAAVRNRVRIAQAAARDGLVMAGLFTVAALVAAAAGTTGGRWLPLHLALAGGLVAAISGATVLLAVTWSAGPAPRPTVTRAQLGLVAGGAAGVAVACWQGWGDAWLVASAASFALGLAVLGVVLVHAVMRGSQRRYDVATAWYVAALVAGIAAAGFGVSTAIGRGPSGGRDAHVALNLLGLVGLVIGGTVPNFVATVGRTAMSPAATGRRRALLLAWQVTATAAVAGGALAGVRLVEAAGLAAYALGIVALAAVVPRPSARSLAWAGPRLLGVHAGLVWWCGAVVAAAFHAAGDGPPLRDRVLLVLVLGGFGQLVWASTAYLVPVLRAGGHVALSRAFGRTRSWTALVAINVAAALAGVGATTPAVLAAAVAVVDTVVRQAPILREAR